MERLNSEYLYYMLNIKFVSGIKINLERKIDVFEYKTVNNFINLYFYQSPQNVTFGNRHYFCIVKYNPQIIHLERQ